MTPYCHPKTFVKPGDYVVVWHCGEIKLFRAAQPATIENTDKFVAFAYGELVTARNKVRQLRGEFSFSISDRRNSPGRKPDMAQF